MDSEYIDGNGYPTDRALDIIHSWNDFSPNGRLDFFETLKKMWTYYGNWREEEKINDYGEHIVEYNISTGGWSGNEEVISALRNNYTMWSSCWEMSRRGGRYTFIVNLGKK